MAKRPQRPADVGRQLKLPLKLTPVRETMEVKDPILPPWYLASHGGRGNALHVIAGRHPLGEDLYDSLKLTCGQCWLRDPKNSGRCTRFSRDVHGVDTKPKWRACIHYSGPLPKEL